MNKRGVLVTDSIGLLIIFILISSFLLIILNTESFTSSITGNIVRTICVDSDGGRNIYVSGTVTKGRVIKKDICSGNLKVREWYCENNNYKYRIMSCLNNKKCSKGACI